MSRRIYVFDPPDRFVAGTVGPPGQRTFFLQARQGTRVVSVVLEKVQVAALAERIGALLSEMAARKEGPRQAARLRRVSGGAGEPDVLDEPLQEAFRVGTLALAWDPADSVIEVEAREVTDDDEDDELGLDDDATEGRDLVRVRLAPSAAERFVVGAAALIAAGRPPCPVCGEPLDPAGHICARRNGYLN